MNRREFLKAGAAACAVGAGRAAESGHDGPLNEFACANVRLTGGPLKRQYATWFNMTLSALDEMALLKVYRQRAGFLRQATALGGWYDADGFVPGHTLGQYISGLSRIYSDERPGVLRESERAGQRILPPLWVGRGTSFLR